MSRRKPLPSLANLPTLGPNDAIGSADSCIQHTLLPPTLRDPTNPSLPLSSTIFHALYHSIPWQTMHHAGGPVPRLVAAQAQPGTPDDPTAVPVYRHPSDRAPKSEPFSRWVKLVREHAEVAVGHPLNHVLIQLYRGGEDYISEHSDKTLDVVRGSSIVNVSFGAQRTMRLRRKKAPSTKEDVAVAGTELEKEDAAVGAPRETQRVVLPHNSLFVLGPRTNQFWLHAIGADKRAAAERSEEEKAYEGMRISLTFRQIGTFLSADGKLIWGQGATKKTRNEARRVVVGDEEQTERMVRAFGVENRLAEGFDWGKTYGDGFDVLHFREEDEEGY
ncbi:hypothetical protein EJ06DRAFT_536122 [Trichodelitschia bisporula]|uniref:Fe2OG dioxygenase domain-containing protein n=1 Tax=Trichodelitschia bisporula TaxID=703511 RepID=A0A6G1I620_9PEZI|nr:hypothetical protein EJ06DRAFT_536122 [Trichodelitschia bisporula]